MKTLTTIEALEQAIDMLRGIVRGQSWKPFEYHDKVLEFEHARDAHRAAEAEAERGRAEIRELAEQRRAS